MDIFGWFRKIKKESGIFKVRKNNEYEQCPVNIYNI